MVGLIILIPAIIVAVVWANGIAGMHEKHPDYKGYDLFDEEDENEIM